MIVSGLTEADIASQIPPGEADFPSRRQTELNVSIIRPMKKILTTLTVIAATALGAQGQTTYTFPAGSSTNSFTGLTFDTFTTNLPGNIPYEQAQLLFGVTGIDFGEENTGSVRFTSIRLSGQGITTTLPGFGAVTIVGGGKGDLNFNPASANTYQGPSTAANLNSSLITWDSSSSVLNFTAQIRNGATASPGARLYYALQYTSAGGNQLNTAFGNSVIVAVPEPSTYVAAAGLLGLFLWSSRRHFLKLAGARSSASGPGENGAA